MGRKARLRVQPKRIERPSRSEHKTPIEERFADEARFFRAWVENPVLTGAVSPSGRYLARMMARYVDPASDGPIVELGPGTGPVTQALIARGVAPERLVLVEYDAAFCRLLRRRFPRCRIVRGDAYDLTRTLAGVLEAPATAVVSSLPLLNKPDAARLDLLQQAFGLMRPGGCFVQFTYGMVSPMPRRPKTCEVLAFDAEPSPPVWLNLPPARVWIYRAAADTQPQRKGGAEAFIIKLRARTEKVRGEFKVRADRMESEIRLHTARARREFERTTQRVRHDKALKPALELLRKIGEPRRPSN
jgi:phosphatidylethanolamine/phosphatidyl-N-methylethanolamine N-methyltransferase